MKQKLEFIIAALLVANNNKEWLLPAPITVRANDFLTVEIHGLQVSTKKELAVMTIDEIGGHPEPFWRKLEITDDGADKMINAIHERVAATYKAKEVAA